MELTTAPAADTAFPSHYGFTLISDEVINSKVISGGGLTWHRLLGRPSPEEQPGEPW